jgi:hypothetical protein
MQVMKKDLSRKIKLPAGVAKAFEQFILHTNIPGGPINNNTWEALYEFIEYTHAHKVRLGDDELRDLLLQKGATQQDADEIASIYLHARNLLYKKRPWDIQRMYGWIQTKKEKKEKIEEFYKRID